MIVPTTYAAGYAEARKQDPQMADLYPSHATIGDPLADAVLASMAAFGKQHSQRWIRDSAEQGLSALDDAPEGFATLISKSFCITGRLVDQGVRRLKQNNLHLLEIFMPDGLDRRDDGWKLLVRIRLVHARVRQLSRQSPEWDAKARPDLSFSGSLDYKLAEHLHAEKDKPH